MRKLSKEAEQYLSMVLQMGDWGIHADDIPAVAELIAADYIRAEDDYEGPRAYLTPKGEKHKASL